MIRIENLTKDYGAIRAVNQINFAVQDGEILGFLGPNGAGKTTTLRIITSYLAPTQGNVFVDDLNVRDDSEQIREQIGYLTEENPLYEDMCVYDFLEFVAQARRLSMAEFKHRLKEVLDLCGLREVVHRPIGELSKGYRQRVGLAQAIIHDPQILILDEPTTGLDPNQIVEIRELIKALGAKKTVIISSHVLQEIQATADRMIIINKGELVADGTIDELMSSFRGQTLLEMELAQATEEAVQQLSDLDQKIKVSDLEAKDNLIRAKIEYPTEIDPRADIFKFAVDHKWTVLEMTRHKTSLEDVFRQLTIEEGGASNEK